MSEKWYIVCNKNTNDIVSLGTVVADPLSDDLFVMELSDLDSNLYRSGKIQWNPETSSFEPTPVPVPPNVSARQIRLWLVQHGFVLSQIDNAINNIEDTLVRETVRIEWEYAPYVERNHVWLVPLAQSLGLNEEQIDQAFREAFQL